MEKAPCMYCVLYKEGAKPTQFFSLQLFRLNVTIEALREIQRNKAQF